MKYAVEEEHNAACVQHMHVEEQRACAMTRAREKKQQRNAIKQKSFVDYD